MAPRIAQRLVDQAVADLRLPFALQRVDDRGEDARLVVEEEDFAVDLRPLRMRFADDAEGALAELLVADGADRPRRERAAEERDGIERLLVLAGERFERRQDLPRHPRIGLREPRRFLRQRLREVVGELLAARGVLPREIELRLRIGFVEVAADRVRRAVGGGVPRVRGLRAAAADDDLRILPRRRPPRGPLLLGHDADHRVAHFAHRHRTAEALQNPREEVGLLRHRFRAQARGVREFVAEDVTGRERRQVLASRAERHGQALFFFEVEAGDAELRIQLGDDAGAAAGHEEHLALVVREPALDLLRALDGIRGGVVELRELERAREVLVRAGALAQRFLDLRTERGGVLRQAADLLQNEEPFGPALVLFEGVGEEAEEGVGLRPLLGFSERLRRGQEGLDVTRIAVEGTHPEGLELVKFFLFDQSVCIFTEPQRSNPRRGEMESDIVRYGAPPCLPHGRALSVRGGNQRRSLTSALKTSNGSCSLWTIWRR
jgi:hypothetical protein